MVAFITRRLLSAFVVMALVSVVVFAALHLIPGDPVVVMLGSFASKDAVERMRQQLGLDRPLIVQYREFVLRALRGDLGISLVYRQSVAGLVFPAYRATLILALIGTVISSGLGILTGVVAASRLRSLADYAISLGVVLGIAMPSFWFAMMLIILFSLKLGWLPFGGYGLDSHLVLPVLALASGQVALVSRMTKGAMTDTLFEPYIQTARAKGLTSARVLWRHALKNALIPVVTVLGLRFGALLGGAVTTEIVFSWPGIGRLIVDAARARDYPIIMAASLLVAASFVIVNLIVDMLYAVIDPRIRYEPYADA